MTSDMDTIVAEYYSVSQLLLHEVQQYELEGEKEADNWLLLLDKREALVQELQQGLANGYQLSKKQKDVLHSCLELDKASMDRISEWMGLIQNKMNQIQKSKVTAQQYNGYSIPEAYGSFFDKRK
ncbi:hypothetical protein KDJ56_20010 [Brevibacillus composti]|uniref:Flagellar protein FliT n=1 Tax=Brevibacillus composti TaxID=2796470 RepID=A0A7T5EKA9_9BACL|nr:hypothetical protein [Brevibacillus composti]QQE74105.1 hypothetical protein JD108_20075 [Brevibacillus composti]QUO41189.1 hypothetical protein KDJ56_20010 [Brevibacillus composti]